MALTDDDTLSQSAELPFGLLQNIITHIGPRRVILFGSRAKGSAHAESDYDLLIIVDDDTPPDQVDWTVMGEVRRGISGAVDLVPIRESTFERRAGIIGSLPWIAATEGIVVYDRRNAASME